MYENILARDEEGDYPVGLSQDDIEKLEESCMQHLGCKLPTGYADFLREANGF